MKKTLKGIIVALAFMLPCGVFAQPPVPENDPTNQATQRMHRSNNETAPIAPATLLLLGLGGAVAGTVVYRNTKNNKEE